MQKCVLITFTTVSGIQIKEWRIRPTSKMEDGIGRPREGQQKVNRENLIGMFFPEVICMRTCHFLFFIICIFLKNVSRLNDLEFLVVVYLLEQSFAYMINIAFLEK